MATFEQRESGWWQAKIRRKGHPVQSKTFPSKRDAEDWASIIESEMARGVFVSRAEAERMTISDAIKRYRLEILPSKRGKVPDDYRLTSLEGHFGRYSLAAVTPAMIAEFRDARLKLLSAQSVVHELNMLSRLYKAAVIDWGIAMPAGIPTALVRKPKVDNERDRRFMDGEEVWLNKAIDQARVKYLRPLFVLAVETAGRQSELLSLSWRDIDLKKWTANLRGIEGRETKSGPKIRSVPLSPAAVQVLEGLLGQKPADIRGKKKVVSLPRTGPVFTCTASALKQAWGHCVTRARRLYAKERTKDLKAAGKSAAVIEKFLVADPMLINLTFHDLRHEATSRLAEQFQMHELMKITGHRSTKMLARYYHPRAEDMAKRMRRSS